MTALLLAYAAIRGSTVLRNLPVKIPMETSDWNIVILHNATRGEENRMSWEKSYIHTVYLAQVFSLVI